MLSHERDAARRLECQGLTNLSADTLHIRFRIHSAKYDLPHRSLDICEEDLPHQTPDLLPSEVFGIPSPRFRCDLLLGTHLLPHGRPRKQHSCAHDSFSHAERSPRARRGSDANTGESKYASTSSGVRNEGSRWSAANAAPVPAAPAAANPMASTVHADDTGNAGTTGCSAIATLTMPRSSRASSIRASSCFFT